MKIDIPILKEGTMIEKRHFISCLSCFPTSCNTSMFINDTCLPNSVLALICHEMQPLPGSCYSMYRRKSKPLMVSSMFVSFSFFILNPPSMKLSFYLFFYQSLYLPPSDVRAHAFIWSSHSQLLNIPSHLLSNLLLTSPSLYFISVIVFFLSAWLYCMISMPFLCSLSVKFLIKYNQIVLISINYTDC